MVMEDKDRTPGHQSSKTLSKLSKNSGANTEPETVAILYSDKMANNNISNSNSDRTNKSNSGSSNHNNNSNHNSTGESKKVAKPPFQNFTKHSKATLPSITKNATDVKNNSIIEKDILQNISASKNNKSIEKYSPVRNPDPASYSSILRKIDSDQQIKKGKVIIDENLNSEHFLTNSDISSNHSVGEKKGKVDNEMIEKGVQYLLVNKAEESSNLISVTCKNVQEKGNYLEANLESVKPLNTLNCDTKDTYLPIADLGFSHNNEPANRNTNASLNINSEIFYQDVFKDFNPNNKIIKYAQLPIEDWLKKGETINEERAKITKQIMSIRIRSSYTHLILTEHINARASALQKWEQQQKTNEDILVKIQSFLEKKT